MMEEILYAGNFGFYDNRFGTSDQSGLKRSKRRQRLQTRLAAGDAACLQPGATQQQAHVRALVLQLQAGRFDTWSGIAG